MLNKYISLKVLIASLFLLVSGVSFYFIAFAYSDQTEACIDRINGHILQTYPNAVDTMDNKDIYPYIQQDIVAFCLSTTPSNSTLSDGEYSELTIMGKMTWDMLENYAARVIFEENLLNLVMSPITGDDPYPVYLAEALKDDINESVAFLEEGKNIYQDALEPAIQDSISIGVDETESFVGIVSSLIGDQYLGFVQFTDNILNNISKNRLCNPHILGACVCFEGFYWDESRAVCLEGTQEPEQQPEPVEEVIPEPKVETTLDFSDVPITHNFFDAIKFLKQNNIVEGYSDGYYRPNILINRAEFTKIIISYLYQNNSGSDCFTDVHSEWYAAYVCTAKNRNIIQGYDDGSFKPENNINLAEALKIVLLAKNTTLSIHVGANWYDIYLNTAQEGNLLLDIDDDPAHYLTRGEMAQLIYLLSN